jgi:hypothetical protein
MIQLNSYIIHLKHWAKEGKKKKRRRRKKYKAESGVAIYSRKIEFYMFTNFAVTATLVLLVKCTSI